MSLNSGVTHVHELFSWPRKKGDQPPGCPRPSEARLLPMSLNSIVTDECESYPIAVKR
jgi:hypothetical protein